MYYGGNCAAGTSWVAEWCLYKRSLEITKKPGLSYPKSPQNSAAGVTWKIVNAEKKAQLKVLSLLASFALDPLKNQNWTTPGLVRVPENSPLPPSSSSFRSPLLSRVTDMGSALGNALITQGIISFQLHSHTNKRENELSELWRLYSPQDGKGKLFSNTVGPCADVPRWSPSLE